MIADGAVVNVCVPVPSEEREIAVPAIAFARDDATWNVVLVTRMR